VHEVAHAKVDHHICIEWKLANPNIRKAEVVVLIILFSPFGYFAITGEGRARIIAVATAVVLATLAYGSFLQEQMY
jgi:hypothetical protein